jgi:hypothetical protein
LVGPNDKSKAKIYEDKRGHEWSHDGIAQSNNQDIQMIGKLQETDTNFVNNNKK